MPFTTFTADTILDEFFGGTDYKPPTTLHVGLSTSAPTKTGGNITEPVGKGYARVAVANTMANFPKASNGTKSNGTNITFPEATGAWGTMTHFVVFDAATGGNAVMYGALTNEK